MDQKETKAKGLYFFNEGNKLYKLGQHIDAVESYDRALEIDPEDALTWYARGDALANLGRYGDAVAVVSLTGGSEGSIEERKISANNNYKYDTFGGVVV